MLKEELTQAELDAIFYGKPPVVVARFFNRQVLDPQASKEAGTRIEKTLPFIHLKCEKEGVENTRPVQAADKKRYAQEWLAFEEDQANELPGQVQDLRAEDCDPYPAEHFRVKTG